MPSTTPADSFSSEATLPSTPCHSQHCHARHATVPQPCEPDSAVGKAKQRRSKGICHHTTQTLNQRRPRGNLSSTYGPHRGNKHLDAPGPSRSGHKEPAGAQRHLEHHQSPSPHSRSYRHASMTEPRHARVPACAAHQLSQRRVPDGELPPTTARRRHHAFRRRRPRCDARPRLREAFGKVPHDAPSHVGKTHDRPAAASRTALPTHNDASAFSAGD